jgi:hypothetical protein
MAGALGDQIYTPLMKPSRRDGTPFANLLMSAPLRDDKDAVRYFIGCQIDVTGLVLERMGIESVRVSLQSDQHMGSEESKFSGKDAKSWQPSRAKESLEKLQELSMMFSQDEFDVIHRNRRGADESDASH